MGDITQNIPTRMTVLASGMMVLASLMTLVLLLMMLDTITHATMQQNLAAHKHNLSMINYFRNNTDVMQNPACCTSIKKRLDAKWKNKESKEGFYRRF